MTNSNLLVSKRTVLEENLNMLARYEKELDRGIELTVYDLFTKVRERYEDGLKKDLKKFATSIGKYAESSPPEISMEYEIGSHFFGMLSKYGHAPAYIVVLNFDPNNKEHREHIFVTNPEKSYKRYCIGKRVSDPEIFEDFEKIGHEDNAVLIKKDGIINAANVLLVNVSAAEIPAAKSARNQEEVYEILGFATDVHARNLSAIGASYHMNIPIYVLSEYLHVVRRFENGVITFSTLDKENEIARQKLERFYIN